MQLAEVKSALNRPVIYGGTRYILKGCTLRKNEKTNELYYQAEIADFNSRSVLIILKLIDSVDMAKRTRISLIYQMEQIMSKTTPAEAEEYYKDFTE